jgi:hypothetical protein
LFVQCCVGDLNFTDLGKTCLPPESVKKFKSCTLKKKYLLVHLFFSDKFKDFKVDNTIFEKLFYPKNTVLEIRDRYLKTEKQCSCEGGYNGKLEYQITSK